MRQCEHSSLTHRDEAGPVEKASPETREATTNVDHNEQIKPLC
jgi:hypothetical protein